MSELTITKTITDERLIAGLRKATAAYNNRPGQSEDNEPVSESEFLAIDQIDPALQQWAETHVPTKIDVSEFLARLPAEKCRAIRMAAATDKQVAALQDSLDQKARDREQINLESPVLAAGFSYLLGKGLIDQDDVRAVIGY